jgi:hypothetical protein
MRDPYVREKFTRNLIHARELAREYFDRYPTDRYDTKVETWREIQSYDIEFEAAAAAKTVMAHGQPRLTEGRRAFIEISAG